jgi:hypothetical protein
MGRFPYEKLVERSPHLSPAGLKEEKAIIDYNVRRHGTKPLQRMLTGVLYRELKDYRIYSMSKRFDNLSLWAKYAGDHSGYCLEFANEGPLFANARDVLYGESLQMEQRRGGPARFTERLGLQGEARTTLAEALDPGKARIRAE